MAALKPLDSNGKVLLEKLTESLFKKSITEARKSEGKTILDFTFNKTRCRVLSEEIKMDNDKNGGVLYWMSRDCRVQDNWSMLYAQRLALKNNMPFHVCFFYKDTQVLYPSLRQFKFLIEGLKNVRDECEKLNINFYLVNSTPLDIPTIMNKNDIGCVVCDFFPLSKLNEWKKEILEKKVPLVEVDAHNIVPAWIASEKQEIAARTIRPKINKKLDDYLTGFPDVCVHPHSGTLNLDHVVDDYDDVINKYRSETDVKDVAWAVPGYDGGLETLRTFMTKRLKLYDERNDPSKDGLSNLSPWLHFGQISAQRCALEVRSLNLFKSQTDSFLEELIVRRELSDNFCHYNPNYNRFEGADSWARKTLNDHRKDKRVYVYTREQFKNGQTHDDIWNCAQFQLLQEGKIHGYMRMYWCKKILEWTRSPEEAIEIALWLNDTFSLDGSDPNGFVGVMWSICGIHDHGWKEREIFGKIRYMVDYSLKKKFDIDAYCARYGRSVTGTSDAKSAGVKNAKQAKKRKLSDK